MVSRLSDKIRGLKAAPLHPILMPASVPSSFEIWNIHDEAVRIRKREKRADSVIIRSLGSDVESFPQVL